MKQRIMTTVAVAAAVLVAISIAPATANADDGADDAKDGWGLIAVDPVPGVKESRAADPAGDSPIPQAYHDALWRLGYTGALDDVNAVAWDDKAQQLVFHTAADPAAFARVVGARLPDGAFTIAPAEHSKAEVDAVLDTILKSGGVLAEGTRIVTAVPATDGSGITIGVEGDVGAASALFGAQLRGNGVPLAFEEAADLQTATRNVHNTTYRFGGAYMEMSVTGGGTTWCTTGFAIGSYNIPGARGLMSADHCGRGTTNTWRYSSNTAAAANLSTYSGMLTPATSVDLGLWYSSTGTAAMYPYVFTGNYTDVATISAVRGGVQPVVGDKVCYSGALSGRVCLNTVTIAGALVCYAPTQCYAGVSYTSQDIGQPAAGNGDSGGPVYASIGGKVYAAGIISGILFGGDDCTGDPGAPGGRQCSNQAIYEPPVYGLGQGTGWGLLIVQ